MEYLKLANCIFFSSSYAAFTEINHIVGHKIELNTFNWLEIIQSMFSEHYGFNYKSIPERLQKKHTHTKQHNIIGG